MKKKSDWQDRGHLPVACQSNLLTAWVAHVYRWQDAYLFVIDMLLVALLLVVCTMPNEKQTQAYNVEWGKVPDALLMAVALCCLAFVLVYGKTLSCNPSLWR